MGRVRYDVEKYYLCRAYEKIHYNIMHIPDSVSAMLSGTGARGHQGILRRNDGTHRLPVRV